MPTLTVTSDHKAVIDARTIARAGEMGVVLTVNVDATIRALGTGKKSYIDFQQANGSAYYAGDYDCSSGTFNVTLGVVDTILTYSGELWMQFVLRDAVPPTGVEVWKSEKVKIIVEDSINATLPVSYVAVPPMTAPTTFPASNVTIADSSSRLIATNAEDAIQEIALDIPFYCTPTGTADDTSYLQTKLDTYKVVVLHTGTYYIDAETKLSVPSYRTIIFEKGAILQAITNDADSYTVLELSAVSNVTIENAKITGDAQVHTGVTGESGHGLTILSCNNIKIVGADIRHCWGDGIYVNNSTNVLIENIIVDSNRRNGFTLISGENIIVDGIIASNTDGTAPQSGIDIEPNVNTDQLKNIVFKNVKTISNTSFGFLIAPENICDAAHEINILIDGHDDYDSAVGLCISGFRATALMTGSIMVNNAVYRESKSSALMIYDYYAVNTPPLIIKNPVIFNPNTANNSVTYPQNCSGISINRELTYAGTELMGNFTIIEPTIIDDRVSKLMKYGIYFNDAKSVGCSNIKILNPLAISGEVTHKILAATNITTGIIIVDDLDVTKRVTSTQYSTLHNEVMRKFINTDAGATSQINLYDDSWFDIPITFTNVTSHGMTIVPSSTCAILPLSAVAGKYINTTVIGATITIRRYSSTAFLVENLYGTWTVES